MATARTQAEPNGIAPAHTMRCESRWRQPDYSDLRQAHARTRARASARSACASLSQSFPAPPPNARRPQAQEAPSKRLLGLCQGHWHRLTRLRRCLIVAHHRRGLSVAACSFTGALRGGSAGCIDLTWGIESFAHAIHRLSNCHIPLTVRYHVELVAEPAQ